MATIQKLKPLLAAFFLSVYSALADSDVCSLHSMYQTFKDSAVEKFSHSYVLAPTPVHPEADGESSLASGNPLPQTASMAC